MGLVDSLIISIAYYNRLTYDIIIGLGAFVFRVALSRRSIFTLTMRLIFYVILLMKLDKRDT